MKVPGSLEKFGLYAPNSEMENYAFCLTLAAETGSGKSDFIVRSAPQPVLVFDLDRNIRNMVKKYAHRDILIKSVEIPPTFDKKRKDDQARDYRILMEIQQLYRDALETEAFRTIFIDTFDALYELARRGILGGGMEFGDVKRTDFSPVNSFMKSFFDEAKSSHVNFAASLHMKDEYKGANPTGKRVPSGWKGTMQCSECHVHMWKGEGETGVDKFHMEILKSTNKSDIEGVELQGDEISFKTLGELIFPETRKMKGCWE